MRASKQETKREPRARFTHPAKPTAREALIYLLDTLDANRLKRCTFCLAKEKEIKDEEKSGLSCNHLMEEVYQHEDIIEAVRWTRIALRR